MTTATMTTTTDDRNAREARRTAALTSINAWLRSRWDGLRIEALAHAGHALGERLREEDFRGEREMRNLAYRLSWPKRQRRV